MVVGVCPLCPLYEVPFKTSLSPFSLPNTFPCAPVPLPHKYMPATWLKNDTQMHIQIETHLVFCPSSLLLFPLIFHRCGRTARKGLGGSSLLFLLPSEAQYLPLLSSHALSLEPLSPTELFRSAAGLIPGAARFKNEDEMAAVILQRRLERVAQKWHKNVYPNPNSFIFLPLVSLSLKARRVITTRNLI